MTADPSPKRLRDLALAAGASDVAVLGPEDVVTAEWVRMKCLYGGCASGRCLTCPPYSPEPSRTRRLLDEYSTIMLLRLDVQSGQAGDPLAQARRLAGIALGLERELFLAGHYKAFAIAGGRPCARESLCESPDACDSRATLRPGPTGCGIDVFATSARAGWTLAVVPGPGEPYHLHALVLVQ